MPWFVAGVVLVALDKFRRKSESDQRVWRIAAISIGLSLGGLGLYVGLFLLPLNFSWLGAGSTLLSVIGWFWGIPRLILFALSLVTPAIGMPAYTLYLTYRAIRSWSTYFRAA